MAISQEKGGKKRKREGERDNHVHLKQKFLIYRSKPYIKGKPGSQGGTKQKGT